MRANLSASWDRPDVERLTFLRCIGGFETFDGTVKVNGKRGKRAGDGPHHGFSGL